MIEKGTLRKQQAESRLDISGETTHIAARTIFNIFQPVE
jgi:hypothetical protein